MNSFRTYGIVLLSVVAVGLPASSCQNTNTGGESFGQPCTTHADCPDDMQCVRVESRLVCGEPQPDESRPDAATDGGATDGMALADARDGKEGTEDATERDGADTTDSVERDAGRDGETSDTDGTIPDWETIGGGERYIAARKQAGESTFCEPPADATVVSDLDEFDDALSSASSGDVVYVASDAEIPLDQDGTTRIPDGITIASNRGCDGADGGTLFQNSEGDPWKLVETGADVRFSGLEIAGPHDEKIPYQKPLTVAISVTGDNFEFDNNDIHGFSHAAVQLDDGETAHLHHNHIHHNPMEGLGYGVNVRNPGDGSDVLIEYNYMNYNRHSIANNNADDSGYEARYNRFGPDGLAYAVGTHPPGGTTILIHHNTVELESAIGSNGDETNISIRGFPEEVAHIHHNWLYNPNPPTETSTGYGDEAIIQPVDDDGDQYKGDWRNVEFNDNHYGSNSPGDCNIGAPRQGCASN